MEKNNFQLLEEEIIQQHGEPRKSIFENITSNLRVFHFIGDLLELFFPAVSKLFVSMSGGAPRQFVNHHETPAKEDETLKRKYPNLSADHPMNDENNLTK